MSTTRAGTTASAGGTWLRSDLRFRREYPHSRAKVWRALTDPAIMALWGMRPEGFAPVVGTRFTLVGKPNSAWRGYVECEVTEARAPVVIAYSWVDNPGAKSVQVRYTLEETPGGTQVTLEHLGFTGLGGLIFSKLIMGPGLRKMLGNKLPTVLAELADDGSRRP